MAGKQTRNMPPQAHGRDFSLPACNVDGAYFVQLCKCYVQSQVLKAFERMNQERNFCHACDRKDEPDNRKNVGQCIQDCEAAGADNEEKGSLKEISLISLALLVQVPCKQRRKRHTRKPKISDRAKHVMNPYARCVFVRVVASSTC